MASTRHTNTGTERRILLGGAVRAIREAKGMKREQFATAAGVHFTYLSKIERGKYLPSADAIARIAEALGVDVDDISYVTGVYMISSDGAA